MTPARGNSRGGIELDCPPKSQPKKPPEEDLFATLVLANLAAVNLLLAQL